MARFVLAWELGAGLGHAVPQAQVARALLAAGHDVHLVWRELDMASALLGSALQHPKLHTCAAPAWRGTPGPGLPTPPRSYADLLCFGGYLDQASTTTRTQAWLDLLRTLAPDVLVTDHAPGALLAAKGVPGLRTAQLGNGYFQPPVWPRVHAPAGAAPWGALPSMRFWEPTPPDPAHEAAVLAACQAAQAACGIPPLRCVAELLHTDVDALLTWPELAPYGPQASPAQTFIGPLPLIEMGETPQWPAGPSARRCLAYLNAAHPDIDGILNLLISAGEPTLLVLSNASASQRERVSAHAHIRLSPGLVQIGQAIAEAALVISLGNSGTVMNALMLGKPALMFPLHTEQWLTAYRACDLGLGVALQPREIAVHGAAALQALLSDAHFTAQAQAAARRHPPEQAQANLARLMGLLLGLLPEAA